METRWLWPFELQEKIGEGGMGVVYRGRYVRNGRQVAVKLLPEEIAANPTILGRFKRELEVLKAIKHPNVVSCFGGVSDNKQPFYAMELVEGGALDKEIIKHGRLPWRQAVVYALQMCAALDAAHQQEVIHRDVKPANFLMTPQGELKLSDFGIAMVMTDAKLTASGKTVGSYHYMAPEQIRGKPPVANQTDLYALGCVIYEMLSGSTPFGGSTPLEIMQHHLDDDPKPISELIPDCPALLNSIVMALLEKDIKKRPTSATAVAAQLEEVARMGHVDTSATRAEVPTVPVTKKPVVPSQPQLKPGAEYWYKQIVLSLAFVVFAVGLWAYTVRKNYNILEQRAVAAETLWFDAVSEEQPVESRIAAIDALTTLARDSDKAIETLEQLLKDDNINIRGKAINALASLNGRASEAVPALVRASKRHDEEPRLKKRAEEVVEAIRNADVPEPTDTEQATGKHWMLFGIGCVVFVGLAFRNWVRRTVDRAKTPRNKRKAKKSEERRKVHRI